MWNTKNTNTLSGLQNIKEFLSDESGKMTKKDALLLTSGIMLLSWQNSFGWWEVNAATSCVFSCGC